MDLTFQNTLKIYQTIMDEKYEIAANGTDTDNYLMAIDHTYYKERAMHFYLMSASGFSSGIIVYENNDTFIDNEKHSPVKEFINYLISNQFTDRLESIKIKKVNTIDITIDSLRSLLST
jgi:hypothetical protein